MLLGDDALLDERLLLDDEALLLDEELLLGEALLFTDEELLLLLEVAELLRVRTDLVSVDTEFDEDVPLFVVTAEERLFVERLFTELPLVASPLEEEEDDLVLVLIPSLDDVPRLVSLLLLTEELLASERVEELLPDAIEERDPEER